jgi:hypothetical protein
VARPNSGPQLSDEFVGKLNPISLLLLMLNSVRLP